jgi:hypothetical protein
MQSVNHGKRRMQNRRRSRLFLPTAIVIVAAPLLLAVGVAWSQQDTQPPPPGAFPSAEQRIAAGTVAVGDHDGHHVGTMAFPVDFSKYANGLIPVTGTSGKLVGYVGDRTGFIPLAVVSAPGFDLDQYRAQNFPEPPAHSPLVTPVPRDQLLPNSTPSPMLSTPQPTTPAG